MNSNFHALTSGEVKQHYSMGLLSAPSYLLYLFKSHGKAGWKWSFTTAEFCQEWGISIRSFYRAIKRLKALNLADVTGGTKLTVSWIERPHSSEPVAEALKPVPDAAEVVPDAAEVVPDAAEVVPDVAEVVPDVAEQKLETVVQQEVCSSTDSTQINTNLRGWKEIKLRRSRIEEFDSPDPLFIEKLDWARRTGKILDHHLSSDGFYKVVLSNFVQIPWRQFLSVFESNENSLQT